MIASEQSNHMLSAILCLAATPKLGIPTNFWLLRQQNIVSTDEDEDVGSYIASLNAGDADGAEDGLAALTAADCCGV